MNKIEQFLIDLKYNYQEIKKNFWLLDDSEHNLEGIAVIHEDPLVIIEVQVMETPKKKREEFYAKLLELNASNMTHGAYGLEGGKVVITYTLEHETLSLEVFREALDAISLALTQHYSILAGYRAK
ncbi:MAG: YbjN domain-containing protein [Treponema sp.]|nr:YbjN domain-containing protein [Treponema sp.]